MPDAFKICGIYGLLCKESNSIYIGQSRSIKTRFRAHKCKKMSFNINIRESIDKYGFDSHEMKILHQLPKDVSQETIDVYEDFYLKQYESCGFNLLNTKKNGGKYAPHSQETIEIMKIKRRSWEYNEKNGAHLGKHRRVPVIQLAMTGEFIREWDSSRLAGIELGICCTNISGCATGKRPSAGGYKWKHKSVC